MADDSRNASSSANRTNTDKCQTLGKSSDVPQDSGINDSMHPRYQKWTIEEEEALCAGVQKHGVGNWLAILSDSQFASTLANRSNINLKDKWRTLSTSSDVSNNKHKVRAHRINVSMPPPTPLPPRYQKWTAEEEEALCAGVAKHGFGNWLAILSDSQFSSSLANRSNINLKDKWRTLSRSFDVSNNKKKVTTQRMDDLMHPHQHSTKKIRENKEVEEVSNPVKEVSNPRDCSVKEASDPHEYQVEEVGGSQACPSDEVSDSQDCPEVSNSHDCPVDEVSDSPDRPVDKVSDSGQRRGTRSYMVKHARRLNSEKIPIYLEKLWLSFPEEKKSSFTYLDPLLYNLYLNDDNKEKVLNWIKKKDIFSRKFVVVPIFQWFHWSVLIFCHFGESFESKLKTPCILLLDSLEKADHSNQLETAIRKFVWDIYEISERKEHKRLVSEMPFLVPKVPQQRNNEENEFYTLYYIKLFVETAPESFSTSGGYPYFMKKDWFNSKGLESFRKAFESSDVKH